MNSEITLDYRGGPNLSTSILKCRRGRQKSDRFDGRKKDTASLKRTQPYVAGFNDGGRGPRIKECRQSLVAGNGPQLTFSQETGATVL